MALNYERDVLTSLDIARIGGRVRNAYNNLFEKLKVRVHLEDLVVDGRISECILWK
jgi:hypothetical protein